MSFELKALKDICTIQIGKTPSRHENDYWRDGTHAWLSIADMKQGRYLNNTNESLYTTNFTEPLSYQDSAFLKLPKFP